MATQTGDVRSAEAQAAHVHEAVFRLPLLAHAALEPLNCTVDFRADACEIWVGSQILGQVRQVAAEAAGLALAQVIVHNHLLGGGFGRRLETDYVVQAVQIARQVRGPVKVTWSREEDTRHDYYRYLNHSRVTVGVNAEDRPMSWRHKVVGPSIEARALPLDDVDRIDFDIVDGASGPYDIPNVQIEYVRHEAPAGLATGYWRGVGPTRNVVIVESVIDDLAFRAGIDPVAYRRSLLSGQPRLLRVLDLVAEKADWSTPLAKGLGRGVAVFRAFDTYLAMVAEVGVEPSGEITVQRVVCAVDAGIVINPDIVRAQIEGGVIFGLSAVLWGKITIAAGRVEQGNFDTYRVMRMRETPAIEVHLVASEEEPGGVGEPGTSGAIAAVANAVFAATGKRAFTLPLDPAQFRQA
jgi:isoquinoline 1-oxidoreductase beta subunit